mmetsp:Transcript_794/g.1597  ORF Transcript_794/g.1597 Transcript_794/m.1597 type:complete len:100 (-) Transcript_794:123-422(-)
MENLFFVFVFSSSDLVCVPPVPEEILPEMRREVRGGRLQDIYLRSLQRHVQLRLLHKKTWEEGGTFKISTKSIINSENPTCTPAFLHFFQSCLRRKDTT